MPPPAWQPAQDFEKIEGASIVAADASAGEGERATTRREAVAAAKKKVGVDDDVDVDNAVDVDNDVSSEEKTLFSLFEARAAIGCDLSFLWRADGGAERVEETVRIIIGRERHNKFEIENE